MPKTRSPGLNDMTSAPTASTTPAKSIPKIVRLGRRDRKSTRLNSSHSQISYADFCLKKKNQTWETLDHLVVSASNPFDVNSDLYLLLSLLEHRRPQRVMLGDTSFALSTIRKLSPGLG